jgi:hypothetical protein
MRIVRRLQDRPEWLEGVYLNVETLLLRAAPMLEQIGFERLQPAFALLERWTKVPLFDCRMCGACTLHTSGMTCPMTCPKEMRNGPCGGVRPDGGCEIEPEMTCVWLEAWDRAEAMMVHGAEIFNIQPPLDHRLQGSSAWLNTFNQVGSSASLFEGSGMADFEPGSSHGEIPQA